MFIHKSIAPHVNNIRSSKLLTMLVCLPLLAACSLAQERNSENSLSSGDTVILNEDLTTPRGEFYIKFQSGEIKQKIKAFDDNCFIESRHKGPITYSAGAYTVTQAQYAEEFYSDGGATIEYSATFYLETAGKTDDDKNKRFILGCKVLDSTMMHHNFPVPDIKRVMGDFMNFDTDTTATPPEQETAAMPEQTTDQSSSKPATASP